MESMLHEFEEGQFKEYVIFDSIFLQLIFQSGGLSSWLLSQPTLIQTQDSCTFPHATQAQCLLMRSVLFCFLATILM